MLTQQPVSQSCVLRIVPPHTDPDQHVSFYVWCHTEVLRPLLHIAPGCKSGAGMGMESKNGRRMKKKEIADMSNYQISPGGLTLPVEISQCCGSGDNIVETYSS